MANLRSSAMRVLAGVLATGVLVVCPPVSRAQTSPTLDDLLERTAAHLRSYVPQLATVVCAEEYVQQGRSPARERRLRSDFLLVHYPPGNLDEWMVFRDIIEVDGEPVADQPQRVLDLFIAPTGDAVARAIRIAVEGLRHHLQGFAPVVVNPLSAIVFLQDEHRGRLRFSLGKEDPSVGPGVRTVSFEETRAAAYRAVEDGRPPLFGRGGGRATVWIEEATGRVLKAEVRLPGLSGAMSTTTFGIDERLGIDVPLEMHTSWPDGGMARNQVTGVATYGQCRRFEIQSEITIERTQPVGPP